MKWGITAMKSKTSLVSGAILLNDCKSYAWVGVVYLFGLLFTVPTNLYFMYHNSLNNINSYINYSRVLAFDGVSAFFVMVVPVLAGLLLLRYLQSGKAADMMHSLPVKRETLYHTHILAGLIILFIPLLVTALVTWIMVARLPINLSGQDVMVWLGLGMLMNLLLFMTSVAVGMITGMSSVQGVLSYILLLLPTGLSFLIFYNLQIFTYGFAADYYASKIEISPLLRMVEFWHYPIQTEEIIAYLLICILLYGLGRYLYQRRHLERAGDALTFDILYPLFKYGVALCGMLLLGIYFYEQLGSLAWTYFAYFLGSLLAYLLVAILYKKSIYVFDLKTLKGYGIFAVTMVVLIIALQFDFAGYEKKIPALDEIESVYLDNNFYALTYKGEQGVHSSQYEYGEIPYPPAQPIYKDKDNIERIHTLQENIIANCDQDKAVLANNRHASYQRISLAYTLKNGKHIYRQYAFAPSKYDRYMAAIYESREYKDYHHEILRVSPADVNLIEIQVHQVNRTVNISDPEQIQAAVKILQNEVLDQSYAEMTDHREPWAYISVYTNDRHVVYLSWYKSYTDFENWLKVNGRHDLARINPERDLSCAVIIKNIREPEEQGTKTRPTCTNQQLLNEWEKVAGNIKITAPHQLEECLQKFVRDEKQDYRILFVLKNGNVFDGYLAEKDLPESV